MENLYFKPELVPIVNHPKVIERGTSVLRELLVRQLYVYLDFTENLEHRIVNQVAFNLGRSEYPIYLPRKMELDAYKLYIDEAYHAMFSANLSHEVQLATGIKQGSLPWPSFLSALERVKGDLRSDECWLADLIFTIVSETLITGTLTKIPGDDRIVSGVREVIKDHADDEAVHHAYFAEILQLVWPTLTEQQQRRIGPHISRFVIGFLEPDYQAIVGNLRKAGFSTRESEKIMSESHPREEVLASVAGSASVTLRHFKNVGAFEMTEVFEPFSKCGLDKYID